MAGGDDLLFAGDQLGTAEVDVHGLDAGELAGGELAGGAADRAIGLGQQLAHIGVGDLAHAVPANLPFLCGL